MREKLRQFMIGRYGTDGLNQFLSMSSIVMLLLSVLFETPCLPQTATGWSSALFLSVFCTGIAFTVTAVQ